MKNETIKLEGKIEKRVSEEGKNYDVIVLSLTDDYTKEVYLSRAETALLRSCNHADDKFNPFK